jgi:hypothetical protein
LTPWNGLSRRQAGFSRPKQGGVPPLAGVRYYGSYSPALRGMARGKRKKKDQDDLIDSILEPDSPSREYKRNWARLIQKICEVDPLTCPKCQGRMRVKSVIEQPAIIKKILQHLGLWEMKARPPPKTSAPQPNVYIG